MGIKRINQKKRLVKLPEIAAGFRNGNILGKKNLIMKEKIEHIQIKFKEIRNLKKLEIHKDNAETLEYPILECCGNSGTEFV